MSCCFAGMAVSAQTGLGDRHCPLEMILQGLAWQATLKMLPR